MNNNKQMNRRPSVANLGSVLPSMIYAIDVGGVPTVAFEATSLTSAEELCRNLWSRVEVASVTSNYEPLWASRSRRPPRIGS